MEMDSISAEPPGFDRLSDQAYGKLRHAIIEGQFVAGTCLTELHLCKLLGMEISPVREALLRLAGDDLVESVPEAGYFVKNLTLDDIHEVYMIRCDLECLAVRMACQKGFPELKLLRLEQACQSQHNADLQWDFTKFDIEDLKFHQALISLANSPRLESAIRSSQLQILSWRGNNAASFDQENARCVMDEHLQIIQALRARDAQAAEKALRNHILVRFESSMADLAHPKTARKISDAHPVGFLGEENQ